MSPHLTPFISPHTLHLTSHPSPHSTSLPKGAAVCCGRWRCWNLSLTRSGAIAVTGVWLSSCSPARNKLLFGTSVSLNSSNMIFSLPPTAWRSSACLSATCHSQVRCSIISRHLLHVDPLLLQVPPLPTSDRQGVSSSYGIIYTSCRYLSQFGKVTPSSQISFCFFRYFTLPGKAGLYFKSPSSLQPTHQSLRAPPLSLRHLRCAIISQHHLQIAGLVSCLGHFHCSSTFFYGFEHVQSQLYRLTTHFSESVC